jgi:hypothetical protein
MTKTDRKMSGGPTKAARSGRGDSAIAAADREPGPRSLARLAASRLRVAHTRAQASPAPSPPVVQIVKYPGMSWRASARHFWIGGSWWGRRLPPRDAVLHRRPAEARADREGRPPLFAPLVTTLYTCRDHETRLCLATDHDHARFAANVGPVGKRRRAGKQRRGGRAR